MKNKESLSLYESILNEVGTSDVDSLSKFELSGARRSTLREDIFLHRIDNAERHLRAAELLYREGMYMSSITRSYYCSYNALRAFGFHRYGHDRWGSHSTLPSHVHTDLPNCLEWANDLQLMRQTRNQCDYDVCTLSEDGYSGKAFKYIQISSKIVRECLERV
ncbi:HEPN domain-containing protein [Corynebacterium variabile]|uniref:HEPN domain-containing protein n=1 Tax=Corynebacterium variabile TaxID=1727 RepID=UPI003F9A0948